MDLDAVRARKPGVVLVDDFGWHATAIGVLRDAGIDVISTVDVRDLERTADEVRQITGQPAAATVPDAALAAADEIRFLDNSPEALRKRLDTATSTLPGRPARRSMACSKPRPLPRCARSGCGSSPRLSPHPEAHAGGSRSTCWWR